MFKNWVDWQSWANKPGDTFARLLVEDPLFQLLNLSLAALFLCWAIQSISRRTLGEIERDPNVAADPMKVAKIYNDGLVHQRRVIFSCVIWLQLCFWLLMSSLGLLPRGIAWAFFTFSVFSDVCLLVALFALYGGMPARAVIWVLQQAARRRRAASKRTSGADPRVT